MFALLGLLCVITSLRIHDDSFAHYSSSVAYIRDWNLTGLLLDLWNRPIPALLYGIPGLLGIDAARLVGAALVVLTGATIWLFFRRLFADTVTVPFSAWIVFFLLQRPVLEDAPVTMTELPAAFFLSAGLYLAWDGPRPKVGALSFGLLPLCRVELLPISAILAAGLALKEWHAERKSGAVACAMFALVPAALWWSTCWILTGNPLWMTGQASAHLRTLEIQGLVANNVFNGLSYVLTPPAFLVLALGLAATMRLATPLGRGDSVFLLSALLVHWLILNTVAVYPDGSLYGTQGVAAVNPRNYSSLAPLIALFCLLGCRLLISIPSVPNHRTTIVLAGTVVALSLGGQYILFNLRLDILCTVVMVKFIALLLLLVSAVCWFLFCPVTAYPDESAAITIVVRRLAVLVTLGVVIADPFLWHPLRFNDQRVKAMEDFLAWRQGTGRQNIPVIQDMTDGLRLFTVGDPSKVRWSWPHRMAKLAEEAPENTLVLVETDSSYRPARRYDVAFVETLSSSRRFHLVWRRPQQVSSGLSRLLDRVSHKNRPTYWVVYERTADADNPRCGNNDSTSPGNASLHRP